MNKTLSVFEASGQPSPGRTPAPYGVLFVLGTSCRPSRLTSVGCESIFYPAWDLLDMPREFLPGCPQCVRVVYESQVPAWRQRAHGGHPRPRGRRHPAPGGQSGHPLSPHYRDQCRDWLEARALPPAGQPVEGVLILKPAAGGYATSLLRYIHINTLHRMRPVKFLDSPHGRSSEQLRGRYGRTTGSRYR